MIGQPVKTIVLDLLTLSHLDERAHIAGLSESERAAIGTLERWSAKNHLAHRTFWRKDLVQRVAAIQRNQPIPPTTESEDKINDAVFEKHNLQPWAEVHVESEQVYADLMSLPDQLSEGELMDASRFASYAGNSPLYTAFLGNCYEHDQEHLAQYYLDRNDQPRAIQIRET